MTKLFYTDKPIFGLDINSAGIRLVAADAAKWEILAYGSLELEPLKVKESIEGNSNYLSSAITTLLNEKVIGQLPSNHVALSIPTSRTYSRTFNLPVNLTRKLKDAMELEADQYIPIPSTALYLDYQIIERKKELTVLMSAVARTIVDRCVAAAENAGLTVSLVEPGISAVSRLLTNTEDADLPSIIVDIGNTSTDIAILEGGSVRVTGGIALGGNSLTVAIAKKLGLSLEDAHKTRLLSGLSAGPKQDKINAAVDPILKSIITETKKVMRYYTERISGSKKVEQLLVVGSGSSMPGIGEYFTDTLVIPARVANPWMRFNFGKLVKPTKQSMPKFVTAAGLSIIDPRGIWQ